MAQEAVGVHPEKDDPLKLGEMILNSKEWIVFRANPDGQTFTHYTSPNAMLIVMAFLVDNPDVRKPFLAELHNQTKFQM